MRQGRHDAQRFGRRVEHRCQPCPAVLVLLLAQRPRLVFHDVLVDRTHQPPGHFQRLRKLELIEQSVVVADYISSDFRNRVIGSFPRRRVRRIRNLALEIAGDHGQRAAG